MEGLGSGEALRFGRNMITHIRNRDRSRAKFSREPKVGTGAAGITCFSGTGTGVGAAGTFHWGPEPAFFPEDGVGAGTV